MEKRSLDLGPVPSRIFAIVLYPGSTDSFYAAAAGNGILCVEPEEMDCTGRLLSIGS